MSDKIQLHNVTCAVGPPLNEFGEYANAFRYIIDGNEVLLDFCQYSVRSQTARVVSRVRIPQELFPVISKRLSSGLASLNSTMLLYSTSAES